MSADKTLRKFEATYRTWCAALEPLGDDDFTRAAADGGWDVARVCGHVGDVSDMLLGNAERCAKGEGERHGFSFLPAFIGVVGSLPPVRVKLPAEKLPADWRHVAEPDPITKADALARLEGMLERMRGLRDPVAAATTSTRREHPAGGWLHARQWYFMNEMHLRHHLRQLRRLVR